MSGSSRGQSTHPALFSAEILGWIYPLTKEGRELSDIVTLAMQVYKHQEFFNLHPKLACLCNFVVKHQLHEMIMDGGTSQDAQVNGLVAQIGELSVISVI